MTKPGPGNWLGDLRRELFDLRREEWPRALTLSLLFFLVVAVFWVVKPIKRGLLLSYYDDRPFDLLGWTLQAAELEQVGKVFNMFAAFVAVVVFTRLVRRLDRKRLLLVLCGLLAGAFALLSAFVSAPGPAITWTLYVFGDLYATLMIGTFWALTNDITCNGEGERSYGVIGLGGVVGGFVGATAVRGWVESVGRAPLLAGCAVTLVLISLLAIWVDRHARRDPKRSGEKLASGDGASVWLEGARLALGSRYLLGVVALVGTYEIVSNVIDFQLAAIVQLEISGSTNKDAFFGLVGQLTGIVSICVQLLMTSWIMRRFGVGVALLVLPMAILGGSLGFLLLPSLALAAVMSTSDNALNYSINQSAREVLYVPLTRDEKYKAKAFIDMFVQRAAKVGAVALNLAVAEAVGLDSVRWLSIAVLAVLASWIALVRWLGRCHRQMVEAVPTTATSDLRAGP